MLWIRAHSKTKYECVTNLPKNITIVIVNCLVYTWNEVTILWNEVTIWWNEVTKGWNEVAWNEVVMERSNRIPNHSISEYLHRSYCIDE